MVEQLQGEQKVIPWTYDYIVSVEVSGVEVQTLARRMEKPPNQRHGSTTDELPSYQRLIVDHDGLSVAAEGNGASDDDAECVFEPPRRLYRWAVSVNE